MLSASERIALQQARPRLVELHRALTRLTSVLTVMNTGAHPDDEQSGLLALLRYGRGMRVVVACSTRGEGGQNNLGPERGVALGILRSRELEEAARVLDADVAWLGFGPQDLIHDFGFSKNGVDTLLRWGSVRLLERLVRAYRRERPDIVIPTFLDVPGQHGHHRAMTEAAEAAISLAADPEAFPEHFADGLTPWRVAKYYLPAWPGGGGTYDDELPPPNATTTVAAAGLDEATGFAFATIGEWSRARHASQGMGRWSATPQTHWDLHLKLGPTGHDEDIVTGLPATLAALADRVSVDAAAVLREAHAALVSALARFPDATAIIEFLSAAAGLLDDARDRLTDSEKAAHGHRIERKLDEIDAALALAAGVYATAWVEPTTLSIGGTATLRVHVVAPDSTIVDIEPRLPAGITASAATVRDGVTDFLLKLSATTDQDTPFAADWSSLGGNGAIGAILTARIGGRLMRIEVDLEDPIRIVPPHSVSVDPDALVLPLDGLPAIKDVSFSIRGPAAEVSLAAPAGITAGRTTSGFRVDITRGVIPGRHLLAVEVDGAPAYQLQTLSYPHIGRTAFTVPAVLSVLTVDLKLPAGARVGYVGGGGDRVGVWLQRMGLAVTDLDAAALAGDLSGYTSIVVGIFAFGMRPDLVAATERLHGWVETGGNLLTLYHRPSDGWHPVRTPLRRLVIGSPSLRWRVTDPSAEVTVQAIDHPLLTTPNVICREDWQGWDKERGLYFAAEWDPLYVPLVSMHDLGEPPLLGGLLSARIGAGRHTHTSLVVHHQLDRLVPGAFRLLANLVQPTEP